MIDKLEAIAKLGIPVQIIAWAGAQIVNMVAPEMKSNWKTRDWTRAVNARNRATPGYRNIEIFMEVYGQRTFGMSTHQKIVILSNGAHKEAYVGGMNTDRAAKK
ncbi:hypothetical protein LPB41_20040 [Thalassospira sp. MA62]|nr:hypothetical protein [Thalassospira sp. MA62]